MSGQTGYWLVTTVYFGTLSGRTFSKWLNDKKYCQFNKFNTPKYFLEKYLGLYKKKRGISGHAKVAKIQHNLNRIKSNKYHEYPRHKNTTRHKLIKLRGNLIIYCISKQKTYYLLTSLIPRQVLLLNLPSTSTAPLFSQICWQEYS